MCPLQGVNIFLLTLLWDINIFFCRLLEVLVLCYICLECEARSLSFTNYGLRLRRQAVSSSPHSTSPDINIDSQSKQELRQLLESYQPANDNNVDDLISSILERLYRSHIEITEHIRHDHRGAWGPISITLESYVLMEQARRRAESADDTETDSHYDDLITQWTNAG